MNRSRVGPLSEHRTEILSDLQEYQEILENLYQTGIIKERRYTQIKSKTERFDAVSLLLQCIEQSGVEGFLAFCTALEGDYPWLSNKLRSASGMPDEDQTPIATSVNALAESSWLQNVPSEKELLAISKAVAAEDWELLALELGLTLAELERAKKSRSFVMRIQSMLVLWQRKEGDNASRKRLRDAIKTCDMDHILQWWKPPQA